MAEVGDMLANAGNQVIQGNFLGALAGVAGSFISMFGGASQADKDREAKVNQFLSATWPSVRNEMAGAIEKHYDKMGKLLKIYPGICDTQEYKNAWQVYALSYTDAVKASQDVSKDKAEGAGAVDRIMGTGKSQGQGYVDIFTSNYNAMLDKYIKPKSQGSEQAQGQAEDQKTADQLQGIKANAKYYIMLAVGLMIMGYLFLKK